MLDKVISLLRKEYKPLNRIEISKANLLHNYKYLSSLNRKVKIAPVVKSNGYGHGMIEVAKILDTSNVSSRLPFFCVDSLYEAYELQKIDIKTSILVMGYTNPENFKIKKLPFNFCLYDLATAKILNQYQKDCKVHLFVDTGMRREGVTLEDLPKFLTEIKQLKNIKVEGLMSHLSSSKSSKDLLFLNQVKNFKKALGTLNKHKVKPKWIHLAASGALINPETRKIISEISNLSRAGISLYGLENDPNLKPCLKFITHLAQIKLLKKGEKTGYEGTFTAKKDMQVGVLPLGYSDGVDRRLSNKGVVTIEGIKCPMIGRVSMNLTTIDISGVENPYIGQEVFVYSNNRSDKNSIENAARLCKTIPYDILIGLAASTKRVIL